MTSITIRRLKVFIPFAVGYFVSYIFRVINSVLAPNLAADIGVDPASLGLLTSAYFIGFGLFQIPLGVLLDRFGPHAVEAALLIIASAGAVIFASADSLLPLVVGRGLIGMGVSACLMAAFKAYVIWFPRQRLPEINGYQMAAGGLGAMMASAPVEAALAFTDWRGVFRMLAGFTLVVAGAIYWVTPRMKAEGDVPGFTGQLRDVAAIFKSRAFWRIAPWAALCQGTYLALQGLWSGPWLRDVAGYDRAAVARTLSFIALAMTAGYIFLGIITERLSRRGIRPIMVAATGMALFAAALVLLALEVRGLAFWAWMLFGFFGTSGSLLYAILSQDFPLERSGRVNTTLNLLVFICAFATQWGMGAVIGLWPEGVTGYAKEGYRTALWLMVALQGLGAAWYAWEGGRMRREKRVRHFSRR